MWTGTGGRGRDGAAGRSSERKDSVLKTKSCPTGYPGTTSDTGPPSSGVQAKGVWDVRG